MHLGIALGGGGAKGLAHIGVLEVLEENGIKFSHVAGTSIGAIIGAIYCLNGTAKGLKKITLDVLESQEFKNLKLEKFYTESGGRLENFKKKLFEKYYFGTLLFKKSILRIEETQRLFNNLFKDKTFSDLKIKFICNSLDINSGNEIIFDAGPLYKAVWASCAIPGILPPLEENSMILIDGGVIDNVPIEPLKRYGCKIIITVYLGESPKFDDKPDTAYKINQRSLAFMKYHLDQLILKSADFVIKPDVAYHHWADFSHPEELIQRGREAVIRNLKELKRLTGLWYKIKKLRFI